MKIFPSLISADLLNLGTVLSNFDHHCDGYHLDVMDDHFVPNLTWGPAFINAIAQASVRPLHIHLMVQDPASWINRISLKKHDTFIFHYEAVPTTIDQEDLIKKIHAQGWHAGIALNPTTPVEHIAPIAHLLDHILIMSVQPGFSGQTFMPEVLQKIQPLLAIKTQSNTMFNIGMDGGINQHNIASLAAHGVDTIAAAAAIFHQPEPLSALKKLYDLV